MGKSTRVRCPSEETGPVSLDGAATAAAHQPRLGEEGLTKPLPIAEEPGKQQRSPAAAAAMRAVSGLRGFVELGAAWLWLPFRDRWGLMADK